MFERQANYQGGKDATPQRVMGRPGRSAKSWFSYDLGVDPTHPMVLVVTYFSDDRRATPAAFDILVDGTKVGAQEVTRTEPRRFYDVEYDIPAALVKGKASVTVRFQAHDESQVATVFGVRTIRGDAAR
jgi:uncharacterized protein